MNTCRRGKHGKNIRIYCYDCKKKVTINNKKRLANELLHDHLNRNSYRTLEVNTNLNRKTICSLTNRATDDLIHSNELTRLLNPQDYCGIILVDGKYVPVKKIEDRIDRMEERLGHVPISKKRRGKTKKGLVVMPFMDYESHDIPVYITALSENRVDIREGFKQLKEMEYPLKAVICDESMGKIAQVARQVYPDVIIQSCLTHYSKCIERSFGVNGPKRRIRSLERKLQKLGDKILIPTYHYDIERARLLVSEISDLEYQYGPLIDIHSIFQQIFWEAETEEDLNRLEDQLNITIGNIDMKKYPYAKQIKDRYLDYYDKRDMIIASIQNPELDIPRTTNLLEGFNSTTLEMRLSSIRGFERDCTAESYINALILKYRFHRFTDCRGKFKHLNGKSPLEIAKPINNFNFNFYYRGENWIRLCQQLRCK